MKRSLITKLLYISTHGKQNQADDDLHPVHPFVQCFLCYIKHMNVIQVINRSLTGYHIERKCIRIPFHMTLIA